MHYGWASLAQASQLPAFFVFPKAGLQSVEAAAAQLVAAAAASPSVQACRAVLVVVDQAYQHLQGRLERAVEQAAQVGRGGPARPPPFPPKRARGGRPTRGVNGLTPLRARA